MLRLKQCPRCNGDLHVARDFEGMHTACLQCGYRSYPTVPPEHMAVPKRKRRKFRTVQALNPE